MQNVEFGRENIKRNILALEMPNVQLETELYGPGELLKAHNSVIQRKVPLLIAEMPPDTRLEQ